MAILLTMTRQKAMNLKVLKREQYVQEFSQLVKNLLKSEK